jgi:hypothetical protein
MIFSLKIKLNHSWKFQRNWNVPLVLSERSWWAGFNGIHLVRFGFRMWEILIFKWLFPAENSNKSQKTGFWKEKSVEDVVTLGPTTQATPVYLTQRWMKLCNSLTHSCVAWTMALSNFHFSVLDEVSYLGQV